MAEEGEDFLDRRLDELWASTAKRLRAAGLGEGKVSNALTEVLERTLKDGADRITADLFERAPAMLSDYRRNDAYMRRKLRKFWGHALDTYRMFWVSAHEIGARFSREHQVEGEPMDAMANAMVGLQARAVRVAAEVYVLLENGMGMGALARARTAHEVAVVSYVLAIHVKTPGHEDIAQRFLDHHAITNYRDAEQYQEVCESIGYEPYSDEEMADFKQRHDAMVEQYGNAFGKTNGWAAGIVAPHAPTFKDLEEMAGLQHLRAHYRWSSHEVHSDAKSWALNTREWQGTRFRDTGPSLDGLADPADMTLISLNQVTTNMVMHSPTGIATRDFLATKVLGRLLDRAQDAFISAHRVVEDMRNQAAPEKTDQERAD